MGQEWKVIVFTLGLDEYGVEVEKIKTIERIPPITRVPKSPVFVKGVINLRGVVIPVIDLRGRFGFSENEYTSDSRIIIAAVGNVEIGLIVDSANDVIDIDSDHVDDPPETAGGIKAKYLQGIAKVGDNRLIVLLNLQEVLNESEIITHTA